MIRKIINFYKEGFLSMEVGKKLWLIIGIKLFILFIVLKLFFFQDFLSSKFDNNKAKSDYVLEELTNLNK